MEQQIQECFEKDNKENFEENFQEDDIIKKQFISVIIPLYNEEHSIQEVINRIPNHRRYEIIVVDDGSIDNSVERALEVKRDIKVYKHEINKGYGAALLTGIKYATGDIIVTMDSDGQHDPKDIERLIKPIINRQADMVIGSRYLGKWHYKVPFRTRLGELFIEKSLFFLYGQKVKNNQSGYRALNRETSKLINEMIYSKFGLCTEILFKIAHAKLRIVEVPINLNPRTYGTSYVNLIKVMTSILSCIFIYGLKVLIIKSHLPKTINQVLYGLLRKIFKKY